ncbi:MAG: hypothetical protein ABIG69_11080 [Bacteroidota bacterium]
MMKRYSKILFFLLFAIMFYCCNDSVVDPPDDREAAIYGKVVNEEGSPIQDIDVHYIFSLSQNIVLRNAAIFYSLPINQTVTLQILDMHNIEIAKPLDQVEQLAGNHIYYWDGSNYTNGIYNYKIVGQTFTRKGSFPLLTDDINALIDAAPLTLSDNNGEFKINYSTLGIGSTYQIEGINDFLFLADSIKFVLHKNGFDDLVIPAKLDTTKLFEQTFKMVRK